MNQIAASFRIAGIIIATTTKVHSLASFGEYNAMSPAYSFRRDLAAMQVEMFFMHERNVTVNIHISNR